MKKILKAHSHKPLWRKLCWYLLAKDIKKVTRTFEDHQITFNPHETIGKDVFRYGHWDRSKTDEVLSLIKNKVRPGASFIELGANIGTQTIYFHLSGLCSRVIAVEASPRNVDFLVENMKLNNFQDKTHIHSCAVAETDGHINLYTHHTNEGAHSIVVNDDSRVALKVPSRTFKSILDEHDLYPEDIGLIWMDIEGYEMEIFKQIMDFCKTKVPIFLEFSPVLYGKKKTTLFIDEIKKHYEACYIFPKKGKYEKKPIVQLMNIKDQADLLFM